MNSADRLLRAYDKGQRSFCNWQLYGANLMLRHLASVNLQDGNLAYANLKNANLKNANLKNANLRSSCLVNADLSGANLAGAVLANATLSAVKGLRWGAASWHGHGECGRQLLLVLDQDGPGKHVYHCGCLRGTRKQLLRFIGSGSDIGGFDTRSQRSRLLAVRVVEMLAFDRTELGSLPEAECD